MIPSDDFVSHQQVPLRRQIFHGIQRVFYWSRLDSFFVASAKLRGATILAWHSVPPADAAPHVEPFNRTDQAVFAAQIAFLAQHRRVIALSELRSLILAGQTAPPGTVVLTFDDAYRDNLSYVAPLLAHYRLPATIFVPTGLVGTGASWIDLLYSAFRFRRSQSLLLQGQRYDLSVRAQRRQAYALACAQLLGADHPNRISAIESLRGALDPVALPPRLLCTWDELAALHQRGFELAAHGVHHLDLTAHPDRTVRAEIEDSRADMERALAITPQAFAYPYGRVSDVAAVWVKAQFPLALIGDPEGLVGSSPDPHRLPRTVVPESLALLGFKSGGAYPALTQKIFRRQ